MVGLGNPGSEYENTRHNVGFRVVDELVRRLGTRMRAGAGSYLRATAYAADATVVLVKPLTFMNNSGVAVRELLKEFPTAHNSLLVVCDDFALPLGTLRVRTGGSDGGHNGLASVISHLESMEFPRLRCGIRKEMMPPGDQMAEFVLSPFDPEEKDAVTAMIDRAADAATECARSGVTRTMNLYNR